MGTEGEGRYEEPPNLAENVRPVAGGNTNPLKVLPTTVWLGHIGILRKGNIEEIYRINKGKKDGCIIWQWNSLQI